MDPFAVVLVGALIALVLFVVLVGRYSGDANMDRLGMRSSTDITEAQSALEAEDLAQMVEARNARRRARGETEVSADDYEMQVMSDIHAQRKRDQEYIDQRRSKSEADRELDELLEATNARRRARGLPERTREDAEREFGA